MNYARPEDIKEVEAVFKQHKKLFPHIRHDYLVRRINDHQCIWDSGIVITYSIYKMKVVIGDVIIHSGSVMLHQIANREPGNGNASKVFQKFVIEICEDRDLFLAVRTENIPARKFYQKQKMTIVGRVIWGGGSINGVVYKLCTTKPRLFS
jgi:hypothetical protein